MTLSRSPTPIPIRMYDTPQLSAGGVPGLGGGDHYVPSSIIDQQ